MTPKEAMLAKLNNLEELNLTTNLLLIQGLAKEWEEAKPDNPKLKQLREAIVAVSLITNKLLLDRGNYHIALDQYRSESLRMVQRARAAEEKNNELQKQLDIFKKQKELGL